MTATETAVQIGPDEILNVVERLNNDPLKQVIDAAMKEYARRKAPILSPVESELLQKINEALPQKVWDEYRVLKAKRKAEILTPEEHPRLMELYNQIEVDYAQRLGLMVELAQVRQTTLDEVMKSLGIRSPGYE